MGDHFLPLFLSTNAASLSDMTFLDPNVALGLWLSTLIPMYLVLMVVSSRKRTVYDTGVTYFTQITTCQWDKEFLSACGIDTNIENVLILCDIEHRAVRYILLVDEETHQLYQNYLSSNSDQIRTKMYKKNPHKLSRNPITSENMRYQCIAFIL